MGKLVLDATTKSITAVLGGAVATTQPDFTAHYADATTTTFVEGANDGTLNSTTPVTLVAAPAASTRRTIVALTVVNRDTAPVVLTVNYVSAGGTRQIAPPTTLAVGAVWTLDTNALSLDHALMTHLAYADAGHTGFQPTITTEVSGPIATHAALITGVHGLVFTAGKTLTLTEALTLNALPIGGLAVATGANTLGSLAVGLATQVLVGGGAGTVPAWAADLPTAVTIGSAYIYRASGTDIPVADGGTGASTLALNGVLFGNAASAVGVTAIGAQYQVLTVGAIPFVPAFSSFLLDGTSGGKTVLAVTNTKTLTLTAIDDYNLTIPATGTAALLNQANSFTLINPLTTIAESWIGPSSTTGIYFKAGNVGLGTTIPTAKLELSGTSNPILRINGATTGAAFLYNAQSGLGQDRATFAANAYYDGSWNLVNNATPSWLFQMRTNEDDFGIYRAAAGATDFASHQLFKVASTGNVTTVGTLTVSGTGNSSMAGNVGIGTILPDRLLHPELANASTAAVAYAMRLSRVCSTASTGLSNNDGVGIEFELETATNATNQLAGTFDWLWVDATNATRKARAVLSVYDTAAREAMRIEASGAAAMLGFLGANAVIRPTALTTQLTTLTHTAPGTPDYAIADPVQNTGYGFSTADEFLSVMAAIANLQTRAAELEDKLGHTAGLGLITH